MCFLTATGQRATQDVAQNGIVEQARQVLSRRDKSISKVHFSFMARGEPLASQVIREHGSEIINSLQVLASQYNLLSRTMISTIMPYEMRGESLIKIFPNIHPNIYYSIYSVDESFRKKWLPQALPVIEAFEILKEYQAHTNKIIKLHWAFIEGENDGAADIHGICDLVKDYKLRVDINLVRYNPFSEKYGIEPSLDHIRHLETLLNQRLSESRVELISRVGYDVNASCGMFVR